MAKQKQTPISRVGLDEEAHKELSEGGFDPKTEKAIKATLEVLDGLNDENPKKIDQKKKEEK